MKIIKRREKSRPRNLTILLVVLIGLGGVGFSYSFLLRPQGPFFWDESFHAGYGLSIYDVLHRGDWARFWEITNFLKLWPFLHSWVVGAFLTVFGPTMVNARLSSLILLIPSLVLLFQISRIAFPGRGRAVGLIASLLFASSPLVLYMASTCMLEMLEVLLVCAFFRAYFGAEDSKRKALYGLAGLFLALLYLTKYNYGLLLLLAFGLDVIIQLWRKGRDRGRALIKYAAIVVAGFTIPVAVWLGAGQAGDKIGMLSWYFRGATGGAGTVLKLSALDRSLFFLRGLANIYSFSIWIFLILLSGLAAGFFYYRDRKIRMIHLTSLLVLLACSIVRNEQDRYIMPVFPLIAIMGAFSVVAAYQKIKSGWPRRAFALILSIFIAFELPLLPFFCRGVANHTAALGSFRYPGGSGLNYSVFGLPALYPEILKQPYSHLNPAADFAAAKHNVRDIWDFIARTVGGKGSLYCLSVFQEFSPHLWRWYSYQTGIPVFPDWDKDAEQCDFFAYIDIGPDSPYYNKEYVRSFLDRNRQWILFLESRKKNGRLRDAGSRFYPDISVIVKIFNN